MKKRENLNGFRSWREFNHVLAFMLSKVIKGNLIMENLSVKEMSSCYPDGTIKSVSFMKNGKRHGLMRQWNDQGELIYEGYFYEGLQEGIHREFHNGIVLTEKNYKNGLLSGRSKEWYFNGRIHSKERYVQGRLHGKQYYWTENGKRNGLAVHQVAFV